MLFSYRYVPCIVVLTCAVRTNRQEGADSSEIANSDKRALTKWPVFVVVTMVVATESMAGRETAEGAPDGQAGITEMLRLSSNDSANGESGSNVETTRDEMSLSEAAESDEDAESDWMATYETTERESNGTADDDRVAVHVVGRTHVFHDMTSSHEFDSGSYTSGMLRHQPLLDRVPPLLLWLFICFRQKTQNGVDYFDFFGGLFNIRSANIRRVFGNEGFELGQIGKEHIDLVWHASEYKGGVSDSQILDTFKLRGLIDQRDEDKEKEGVPIKESDVHSLEVLTNSLKTTPGT